MKANNIRSTKDSETWGDNLGTKDRNNYRCCFQNINGLGSQKDDPKRELIRHFIKEHDIDFYLMAEINVNWRVVSNRHSIHDMTRGWFESQKIKTSFNRHCRACHRHQPGGTAIITRDGPSLHFESSGEDKRHLGRWSWQRFQGKKGYHLRVLSVYFPTRSYNYGNKKVYDQQQKALLGLGITKEVHKSFWSDFWSEIDEWLLMGDKLIIGGDWNLNITNQTLLQEFRKRDLLPAVSGKFDENPPPTYHRASRYAIDEIFVSSGIDIINAGYLPFGTGVGDHRPIWFDFTISSSLGRRLPPLNTFPARRLKCQDPSVQQRYVSHLIHFLTKHNVFQRAQNLMCKLNTTLTHELTKQDFLEYERLDLLRTRGMLLAEKKCRRLFMGGRCWSPILQRARDTIRYLTLCISRLKGCKVGARTLLRLSNSIHLYYENQTLQYLQQSLSEAFADYATIKKAHRELRNTFLETLATRLEDAGKGAKAGHLRQLLSIESQRAIFRQLKFFNKSSDSLAIKELEITNDNGEKVLVTDQAPMEEYMGNENVRKYHQTETTCPFFSPSLRKDLGDLADGPCVKQVLDGSYLPANDIDPFTTTFLTACKQRPNSNTFLHRSEAAFQSSWGKMKEKTSSRNLHFGHFKTGVQNKELLSLHYQMAEIPFRTGYSPNRWQHATQLMILKKLGLIDVQKLRTLVLYEADFNHNNKFLGKAMMEHMQNNNFLAKEQYSAPGKKCIDHVLNRRLLFDITRYSKQSLGLTGCDLSSCYDRVTHTPAMLAMASYGIPMQPLTSMFYTIQHCRSTIRTAFGESIRSFGGHDERYIALPMGLGQGNGSGPSVWTVISSKMFEVLYKNNLSSFFHTPISQIALELCGFAFVDDTDLVCTVDPNSSSVTTLTKMQNMVDTWEGTAKTTGGAIETSPDKSWWYLIDFKWNKGSSSYVNHEDDERMVLTARNKQGVRDKLTYVAPHVATKMLGVFLAPNGDESTQRSAMIESSHTLARKFGPAPLNQFSAWTALTCIAYSKLSYPLPATTFSEKTCKSIIWPILKTLLPKCHIARSFPQKLLYGPSSCLGLELPSLFIQQGIFHIVDIIEHMHYNDVTGHLIRAELEHLHLETGQPSFSFTNRFFDTHSTLLTHSWAVETWRFMQLHAITIDLHLPQFRLRRLNDTFLMPALLNSSIPKIQWKQFNKCRLYLNVISLADISTGDGIYLREDMLNGIFDRGTSRNSVTWPARQRPPSSAWTVWNTCLLTLFCTGTTGRLVTRLGEWYQHDICNKWEWYIHTDSSSLLQTHDGTIQLFNQQGRSRLSPKFSNSSVPVNEFDSTHYLRTTITRTSKYIHSHGSAFIDNCTPTITPVQTFNWLHFKVIRTPSIELLLHDLILHQAFAVTDGSYHPFDESGAAAWTIESSDGTEYISGISLIPGDASIQSAIRSELIGILAIFSYIQKLIDEFAMHNVGGVLGCDCRSALESTFHSYRPPKVSDHHADIKASIYHFVQAGNISLQPMHIYAHQDDFVPFHKLSIPEQLNVRMDFLAKQARIDYADLIQNTSLPISIPFSFAPVRVRGCLISDNIKKELLHRISMNIALTYWIDKGILTKANSTLVYFKATSKASSLSRLSMRIFISKWASGHLGTGKVVVRNNYRLEGSCPFCLHLNEDTSHILDCQHVESIALWKKHLMTLVLSLHKARFPNHLIIAIKRELNAWRLRHAPHPLEYYPEPIRSMIKAQRSIGWNQFLLGFLPMSWKPFLLQYLREKHLLRRYSPDLWASKIIRSTWQLLHDTWEARCQKLHNTDRIHDLSGQQVLLESIRKELAIGLHNLPACDFTRLFSIPHLTLFNKPLDFLKDWFVTVRSGRILYNDTSLLNDKFTTELSLRRWVGLPLLVDHDSENEFSDHE